VLESRLWHDCLVFFPDQKSIPLGDVFRGRLAANGAFPRGPNLGPPSQSVKSLVQPIVCRSRQQVLQYIAVDVCQTKIAALEAVGELLVVDAQQV